MNKKRVFKMTESQLKEVLKKHKKWLNGEPGGEYANLQCADLRGANLQDANLRGANLRGANLQDANLQRADLRDANLQRASLQRADLRGANLQDANLQRADLRNADLRGADIDYSSGLPLWCYGLRVHIDDRIGIQLLYHAVRNILYSKNTSKWLKVAVSPIVWVCNKFHRVNECGELTAFEDTAQKEENEQ